MVTTTLSRQVISLSLLKTFFSCDSFDGKLTSYFAETYYEELLQADNNMKCEKEIQPDTLYFKIFYCQLRLMNSLLIWKIIFDVILRFNKCNFLFQDMNGKFTIE